MRLRQRRPEIMDVDVMALLHPHDTLIVGRPQRPDDAAGIVCPQIVHRLSAEPTVIGRTWMDLATLRASMGSFRRSGRCYGGAPRHRGPGRIAAERAQR